MSTCGCARPTTAMRGSPSGPTARAVPAPSSTCRCAGRPVRVCPGRGPHERRDPDINIVGTFSSATEAAAQARELAPQLMLLDIRMPELDGFELVAACAEQGLNPYVIFVTAYSDRSMDAFGVGAIDYLLKPFDDERFGRAVARAKSLIASA